MNYLGYGIAAVVAVLGWIVVNRQASRRDLQNWRRTTLTQAVSTLIEASNSRDDAVNQTDWVDPGLPESELRKEIRRMQIAHDQIRICDARTVSDCAHAIIKRHVRSHTAIEKLENSRFYDENNDPVDRLSKQERTKAELDAQMDEMHLAYDHEQMIKHLQVELGLKKLEGNTDHAKIITQKK